MKRSTRNILLGGLLEGLGRGADTYMKEKGETDRQERALAADRIREEARARIATEQFRAQVQVEREKIAANTANTSAQIASSEKIASMDPGGRNAAAANLANAQANQAQATADAIAGDPTLLRKGTNGGGGVGSQAKLWDSKVVEDEDGNKAVVVVNRDTGEQLTQAQWQAKYGPGNGGGMPTMPSTPAPATQGYNPMSSLDQWLAKNRKTGS